VPHILVIDDEDELRRTTARLLAAVGYSVTEAATGPEGFRLWRERRSDLVLTDIHMPEGGGIELICQLRAEAPTLPVIAMSGSARSRDLDQLRDSKLLGTVRVIQKPFGWATLSDAVTAALGTQALPG
jgi:CheY-like chemotaxis protein